MAVRFFILYRGQLADECLTDWEIGIRESGGPEMAAIGDLIM